LVIFHAFAQKLPVGGFAPNLVLVGVADAITCDSFWRSVNGGRICGRWKISGSHWQNMSPLILCCRYHAASDYCYVV